MRTRALGVGPGSVVRYSLVGVIFVSWCLPGAYRRHVFKTAICMSFEEFQFGFSPRLSPVDGYLFVSLGLLPFPPVRGWRFRGGDERDIVRRRITMFRKHLTWEFPRLKLMLSEDSAGTSLPRSILVLVLELHIESWVCNITLTEERGVGKLVVSETETEARAKTQPEWIIVA